MGRCGALSRLIGSEPLPPSTGLLPHQHRWAAEPEPDAWIPGGGSLSFPAPSRPHPRRRTIPLADYEVALFKRVTRRFLAEAVEVEPENQPVPTVLRYRPSLEHSDHGVRGCEEIDGAEKEEDVDQCNQL